MEENIWVVCQKCGSKFDKRLLERKQVYSCQLCKEPGLRLMDANGNATDTVWPEEKQP